MNTDNFMPNPVGANGEQPNLDEEIKNWENQPNFGELGQQQISTTEYHSPTIDALPSISTIDNVPKGEGQPVVSETTKPEETPQYRRLKTLFKRKEEATKNYNAAKKVLDAATVALLGATVALLLTGCASDGKKPEEPKQPSEPDRPPVEDTLIPEASPAPELASETISDAEYISTGYIETANGDVECFEYKGGYHEENDPYAEKFAHKEDKDYENDDAYGFEIEGDTIAEKTSNWIKRVMASPEATTRLRVQMGLENLDSIEKENEYANKLRDSEPEKYDEIVNDTAKKFYENLKGGQIIESHYWTLENYMFGAPTYEDGVYTANPDVHGRLNNDDETGENKDLLLTFYNKGGINFVSSRQGFLNTAEDAKATYLNIGQIAWVDMDEGGTWKWKSGENKQTPATEPTTETPVEPEKPAEPAPAPVVPEVPPAPTPDSPTPYIPPAETPAPKDAENLVEIDTNAAEDIAEDYGSTPIEQGEDVGIVTEEGKTEAPADTSGDSITTHEGTPGAGTVGAETGGSYSESQGPAHESEGPVEEDHTPPAEEVENPPEGPGGTDLGDILGDLGINSAPTQQQQQNNPPRIDYDYDSNTFTIRQ